ARDAGFDNPQNISGKDDFSLSWKEQAPYYRNDDMQVINSGEPKKNITEPLTTSTGDTLWIRTSKVPLPGSDGKPSGILGVYEDITHQRYLEEQLAEKQKILESVTALVPDLVYLYDIQQDNFIYSNIVINGFFEFEQNNINSIRDQNLVKRVHPDDLSSLNSHLEKIQSTSSETIFNTQFRVLKDKNEYCWYLLRERVYQRDVEGNPKVIFGVCQDINEREVSSEKLRASEQTLKLFVEYAPAAIAMFDKQMNYIAVSNRFLMDYRLTEKNIIGLNHYDVFPEISDRWKEIHQRCLLGATIKADEDPFPRADGYIDWVRWEIRPWYDSFSNIGGILLLSEVITERKEAQEKLFLSEQHLRAIIQTSYDGFCILNNSGYFLDANQAFSLLTGYSQNELLTMQIIDFEVLESQQNIINRIQKISQIKYDHFETRHRRKDGSIYDVEISVSYLDINGGEMICFCRDITQRKQTEISLRTSEDKYRKLSAELEQRVQERTAEVQDLYDNAPVGYFSLDTSACFSRVNQTVLQWMGYHPEEVIGKPFTNFILPENLSFFLQSFTVFKQTGLINEFEIELIKKDGGILPVSINSTAIYNNRGEFLSSRTTMQNISLRKAAEAALRDSEEQNRLLFEESPDAILLIDKSGKILRVNRALESLIKLPRKVLLGKFVPDINIINREDTYYFYQTVNNALNNPGALTAAEYRLTLKDEFKSDVESHFFVVKFGGSNHLLITTRDITSRKQAEKALWRANQELEKAMRMRDEFMASMSHELRTPLTGILGLSEALQEMVYGSLNDKQLHALSNIEISGRHLLELINDILDVSKLEAGKLDLQIQNCGINQICQSSIQLIKGLAQKKKQEIRYSLPPNEIYLQADPRRIKQIIVNLLSNAVKYTPEGGEFGLNITCNEEDRLITINVWDKGIGIKTDDLHKLFQPFVQLDSSLSRQQTGTGLGL
ncbi:MAG: PAS domain S-box protein, partial [Anaerolineae bacterium]|nr:PAS domain S-box protein [Anaerolineae bacterium]